MEQRNLTSLCNECYEEIPAELTIEDDGVWLEKECPAHGKQREQMDVDPRVFSISTVKGADAADWYNYIGVTVLDVTDRCNVKCPHCYALPNNKLKDQSIERLVEISRLGTKTRGFTFMGAEPTMRADLGELVSAVKQDSGKLVNICTNAVKLADQRYFDANCEDIHSFCVSLHTTKYLNNAAQYAKKLRGIENIVASGKNLTWLAFTLLDLDDIEEAIDVALRYKGIAQHIRLRSPGKTGICNSPPFYMSQLLRRFHAAMHARGVAIDPFPSDNNPYHMNFMAGGQLWRLICAPSVETIVMEYLQTPPYALLVPELGETNLAHQGIFQVGLKEGKARLPVKE